MVPYFHLEARIGVFLRAVFTPCTALYFSYGLSLGRLTNARKDVIIRVGVAYLTPRQMP
jgi:hypothetical protein